MALAQQHQPGQELAGNIFPGEGRPSSVRTPTLSSPTVAPAPLPPSEHHQPLSSFPISHFQYGLSKQSPSYCHPPKRSLLTVPVSSLAPSLLCHSCPCYFSTSRAPPQGLLSSTFIFCLPVGYPQGHSPCSLTSFGPLFTGNYLMYAVALHRQGSLGCYVYNPIPSF